MDPLNFPLWTLSLKENVGDFSGPLWERQCALLPRKGLDMRLRESHRICWARAGVEAGGS